MSLVVLRGAPGGLMGQLGVVSGFFAGSWGGLGELQGFSGELEGSR